VPTPPSSFIAGAKIALVSDVDGNFEIYLAQPNGSGLERLTHDPGMDLYPDFTPDRREIVWCSNRAAGIFAIYRMWVDGSHPIKLTTGTAQATQPAVSPDGTKIAFVRWTGAGTSVISVMNRDGSGEVRLTPDGGQAFGPSWSPDGTTILFGSNHADGAIPILYRIPASGGTPTALTQANGADYPVGRAAWSPTANRIAYATNIANRGLGITVIDATGGNRLELTHSNDTDPVWSPDGNTILYTSGATGISHLATIGATGTGLTVLTSGTLSYAQPDW
jgi:TolB protein